MAPPQIRKVKQVIIPKTVTEGAGVRLKRSIATPTLDYLDPFLLFDHFGSNNPDDYLAGFPMHPHRGIETVTYMLEGFVNHRDSLGNTGTIGSGDVQWMTSGRGIMHEEMPQHGEGRMEGFQLWVNLPAKHKMTAPRYQEVLAQQIPEIQRTGGVKIRLIAGSTDDLRGPVVEIAADPTYLDVFLPGGSSFSQPVERGHTAFAYTLEGGGFFEGEVTLADKLIPSPRLIIFADGDTIHVQTHDKPVRFLLISGKPLNEPIARYGPFVMNTKQEIAQALSDLQNGTFVS
jgi:quercetin 2,3-dioxygenase